MNSAIETTLCSHGKPWEKCSNSYCEDQLQSWSLYNSPIAPRNILTEEQIRKQIDAYMKRLQPSIDALKQQVRPTWEQYALTLAKAASTRSEDPYVKVGAVILRSDHTVASVGYNGVPAGVKIDWTSRDGRRPYVIHAEANALRYIKPGEAELLATTLEPCIECVKTAASYGIRKVIYSEELENVDTYDRRAIHALATKFDVKLIHIV